MQLESHMNIDMLKTKYRYGGLKSAATEALHQAANGLAYFDILIGMTLTPNDVDPEYLVCPPPFSARFLTDDEATKLGDDFVKNGDRCFAIMDGDGVASAGWYASKPTHVTGEFKVSFDPRYAYMHHGFTAPAYRGKRLHAIGMGLALQALGVEGLVSVVAGNNQNSLKSTRRLGYQEFGHIYLLGRLGYYIVHADSGCRKHAFTLVADPHVNAIVV